MGGEKAAYVVSLSFLLLILGIFMLALMETPQERVITREPRIVVLPLFGIIDEDSAIAFENAIRDVADRPDVVGVVIRINSPGGFLQPVIRIFNAIRETAQKVPVVAYIDGLGTSGGYYAAVGASHIYASPGSLVGSIGVILVVAPDVKPIGDVIYTGPYKLVGIGRLEYYNFTKAAQRAFIDSVEEGRGERLKASREELALAKVYRAETALSLGLIDGVGSIDIAVDRAAELAGVLSYRVEDKTINVSYAKYGTLSINRTALLAIYGVDIRTPRPKLDLQGPGGGERYVLVDLSHNNWVWTDDVELMTRELVRRGLNVVFATTRAEFKELLPNASALIIYTPWSIYEEDEVRMVAEWANSSERRLVLIYDPQYGYSHVINTLAGRFGVFFYDGALLNADSNYVVPLNVYVDIECPSLQGTAIFFGAAPIEYYGDAECRGVGKGDLLGIGSDTYTMLLVKGNVIAVGDQAFMRPWHVTVGINADVLSFIADFISEPAATRE